MFFRYMHVVVKRLGTKMNVCLLLIHELNKNLIATVHSRFNGRQVKITERQTKICFFKPRYRGKTSIEGKGRNVLLVLKLMILVRVLSGLLFIHIKSATAKCGQNKV